MSNFIISPNMSLPVPTPGQDPGPDYATNNSSSLNIIDGHNHSPGSGVQINPNGININSDLQMNGNNLTTIHALEFNNLSATLPGSSPYLNTAYAASGNLYFNDGSGNVVQITKAGSVNATSSGISSGTASAAFSAGVLVVDANTNTPANIQCASILLGNNVSGSNYLTLSPPSSLASNYSITLPLTPGSTGLLSLDNSGTMAVQSYQTAGDNVGQAMTSVGANPVANARTRTVGTSVAAGGIAISAAAAINITNGSYTSIGVTATITTTGRPVMLMLMPDGSGTDAIFGASTSGGSPATYGVAFANNGTTISQCQFTTAGTSWLFPPGAVSFIDTTINGTPGTYAYTCLVKVVSGTQVTVNHVVIAAYEL